jgi:hypothetical protein
MESENKKYTMPNLNSSKVEERYTSIDIEPTFLKIEEHPLFVRVIEKSKKDASEGKGFSHEEIMNRVKEKYPFLK